MKKILYLSSFTVNNADFSSSDAIGYGITSSNAIYTALQNDFELIRVPHSFQADDRATAYLEWSLQSYQEVLRHLKNDVPDGIFFFHSFQQFPQEIKKMLYHLNLNVPLIGYTHGSHWDPTDTFRHIHTPDLQMSDVANFCCLDALLFVTQTFKATVLKNIEKFNPALAEKIAAKGHAVGLPINTALIDSYYQKKNSEGLTIVFNHAPVPSKNIGLFLEVIRTILTDYPHVKCHITRQNKIGSIEYEQANALAADFAGRLTLSQTLGLADYYRLLWQSDLQVSTATHESLGVATLEAMYTENCCILPDIGAYAEISDGTREHLYQTKDELITKLKYFIENDNARKETTEKLVRAARKYSMEYLYPRFSEVISGALKS